MSAQRPIVICYDGSPESRRAITEAGRLFPGERAVVLHVWEPIESTAAYRYSVAGLTGAMAETMRELDAAGAEAAARIADEGALLARQAGLEAEPVAEEARVRAWVKALETIDAHDASLAIMGARGRGGLGSMGLGSFSAAVLHHARRPVLIVPPQDR